MSAVAVFLTFVADLLLCNMLTVVWCDTCSTAGVIGPMHAVQVAVYDIRPPAVSHAALNGCADSPEQEMPVCCIIPLAALACQCAANNLTISNAVCQLDTTHSGSLVIHRSRCIDAPVRSSSTDVGCVFEGVCPMKVCDSLAGLEWWPYDHMGRC